MDDFTTILLIRHGETPWNRETKFRGVYDIPLNENGRAQARLAGEALKNRKIDAVYTSPLSRAKETAELAVGGRGIEIKIHNGLTDFDYGHWTGLPEDEVARRWPSELGAWKTRPHAMRVPGGDTLAGVSEKAFGAMEEIAEKHRGETVALFAHRVVNKLLVLGALDLSTDRFPFIRQDNCCINEFRRVDGGYVIFSINDVSHLKAGSADLLSADF